MAKWTVQELIDRRMKLHAYCHNPRCHHNKTLDLAALRDRLGPDAHAMADNLIPKLRCEKCGGKAIGLTYTPTVTEANQFHRNANSRDYNGR